MTPHKISTSFLRLAPAFAVAAVGLAGCSTIKSVSPFGSNIPYASAVQPTIARPAVTEIPAYKPKPEPPPVPKPAPPPPPPPPAVAAPPAPMAPPPPAAAEPPLPAPLPEKASQADLNPPKVAQATPAPAPDAAPVAAAKPAAAEQVADESATSRKGGDRDAGQGPSIPAADRKLSEDGAYPNLAQVPARPVNMPTFAEAASLEKTLVADREKAKDAVPASPEAPAVDSAAVPVPVPAAKPGAPAAPASPVAVAARAEDAAPCLNMKTVSGDLTVTLHFDPGSAAITTGNRNILAEAMPTIQAAKGTIRIFGHGDNETGVASARFDLAAARAAAVAQAIAGYGIAVPRIAVGVACADAAVAGASVQLYSES